MLGEVGRQRSSYVGGIRIYHLLSVTASTGRRGNIKTPEHSFDHLLGADVSKQYRMPVDENLPTALFLHRPQREHSYKARLHSTPILPRPAHLVPGLQPLGVHSMHREGILQLEGALPQVVRLLRAQVSHCFTPRQATSPIAGPH